MLGSLAQAGLPSLGLSQSAGATSTGDNNIGGLYVNSPEAGIRPAVSAGISDGLAINQKTLTYGAAILAVALLLRKKLKK